MEIIQILMLFNIFSRIEPSGFLDLNQKAIISIILTFFVFLFLSPSYWIAPATLTQTLSTILSFIFNEFSTRRAILRGWDIFTPAIFIILCFLNLIGLIPYCFATTSFPIITFLYALIFWLTPLLLFLYSRFTGFFASFLPAATPLWLSFFIALIEVVRTALRPLTLAFRVSANITAGHLILLLRSQLTYFLFTYSLTYTSFLLIVQRFYVVFELCVCILQATIFCILLIQYTKAH